MIVYDKNKPTEQADTLLSQLDCRIFGLESIKEQYALDPDFKDMLLNC